MQEERSKSLDDVDEEESYGRIGANAHLVYQVRSSKRFLRLTSLLMWSLERETGAHNRLEIR